MKKFTRFGVRDAAPNDPWRPSSTPIYQTATFEQESPEHFGRYDYARSGNPTRAALEEHCARLEGACGACAFASGIAAVAVVTRLVRPGETIVAHEDLYGGSQRLLTRVCAERGIDVRYADLVNGDRARWSAALPATTALVLVESLSNPLWRAPDLRALADVTHERGAILCVDATAMSPWLQRPLALGADVVVHSATKLLSGHGDLTAGIVACAAPELQERIAFLQNAEGAVLGPFDSWLLLRGMKTLGVRIERQQESARRVAEWLAARDDVTRVHFASLASHPDRERHARQADGPGVVLSFETGDDGRSADIVRRLDRFAIAVSFGSVDSSASLPCRMSHASVPADRQLLPPDLIRLSIGLEDPEDLIADLERALPVAQRLCPLQERVGVR